MLDALTADDFRPHIGAAFRLTPAEGEAFVAVLATVTDYAVSAGAPRPPFALAFRAPADTACGQGMYRVERDGADPLEIFLVPIGPDPESDGMLYEASFG